MNPLIESILLCLYLIVFSHKEVSNFLVKLKLVKILSKHPFYILSLLSPLSEKYLVLKPTLNKKGTLKSQSIINNQDPTQPGGNNLINGNKINPRGRGGIKLSSKVIIKFDQENFVIRSFQVNKSNLTKSILNVNRTVKKIGPVSELVNLGFMNNTSYIRTCSFFDIHLTISDYLKYGVITKQQYNNVFSSLISYASKQDINNSILITYKDELLNNEQNFYNILHNRLIYMNNTYSVLVLDYRTDSFVRLSYKAKN
uniref:Uncharacterized protein n=1 Tax=Porodaedalea pini TaxID=108901 RepID=A0A5B9R908_9AGAM|nr:hypothetical protein PPIT_000078 [Porodaedalea pini]QEG56961.1 hypothetical protein PPIT_000078 [Porodaedalea pini]